MSGSSLEPVYVGVSIVGMLEPFIRGWQSRFLDPRPRPDTGRANHLDMGSSTAPSSTQDRGGVVSSPISKALTPFVVCAIPSLPNATQVTVLDVQHGPLFLREHQGGTIQLNVSNNGPKTSSGSVS